MYCHGLLAKLATSQTGCLHLQKDFYYYAYNLCNRYLWIGDFGRLRHEEYQIGSACHQLAYGHRHRGWNVHHYGAGVQFQSCKYKNSTNMVIILQFLGFMHWLSCAKACFSCIFPILAHQLSFGHMHESQRWYEALRRLLLLASALLCELRGLRACWLEGLPVTGPRTDRLLTGCLPPDCAYWDMFWLWCIALNVCLAHLCGIKWRSWSRQLLRIENSCWSPLSCHIAVLLRKWCLVRGRCNVNLMVTSMTETVGQNPWNMNRSYWNPLVSLLRHICRGWATQNATWIASSNGATFDTP